MRGLLLFIGLAIWVGQAAAANLQDVYRLARQNDAQYASAQAAYKAGMEALPQGRALMLPRLDLSAGVDRYHTDTNLGPPMGYTSPGAALTLTLPLYRKQNLETLAQARLQVRQVRSKLDLARQGLILRTARAYFDVLQAEDDLATVEAQKAAVAEQLALARKSFQVGTATIVDTDEAQAGYDSTVAQEIAARNDLDVKRRALEKLIRVPAPALEPLAKSAAAPLPRPDDMQAWVKRAEMGSLSVAIGRDGLEIADREVDKQNAGYLPSVDLTASYSDVHNEALGLVSGVDSRSAAIGLRLGWNLYQGGATRSRVREAVAKREQARFDLENARRQAALDARAAFLDVKSGDARIKALQQLVSSSRTKLQSTKLGRKVGVRTALDVLNAEQALYGAERDLAAARYAVLLSVLRLKAAAGSLGEKDLVALNGLLAGGLRVTK